MRAALRAEYGINLSNPDVSLPELAELVMYLPPGSVLWQDYGGPMARSREEQTILLLDLHLRQFIWLQGGKKGKEPKYPDDPPYAHERRQKEERMSRKAEAFLRRQWRSQGG